MILLTTPFQHGAESYTHLAVRQFDIDLDRKYIRVAWRYGTLDGNGSWVVGKAADLTAIIEDREAHLGPGGAEVPADPAYSILVATSEAISADEVQPGDGGFKVYTAAGRNLDTWALANLKDHDGSLVVGSIV